METAMPQPKTKPPKRYLEFQKNFPKVGKAYETLGANLESAAKAHTRLAIEAGATAEELRHAAMLATRNLFRYARG